MPSVFFSLILNHLDLSIPAVAIFVFWHPMYQISEGYNSETKGTALS